MMTISREGAGHTGRVDVCTWRLDMLIDVPIREHLQFDNTESMSTAIAM